MVVLKSWDEFRESGILWWVNMILRIFGWAIVVMIDTSEGVEKVIEAHPARVSFSGFTETNNNDGYKKITKYLKDNIEELERESQLTPHLRGGRILGGEVKE